MARMRSTDTAPAAGARRTSTARPTTCTTPTRSARSSRSCARSTWCAMRRRRCSNVHVLRLLRGAGALVDAVSLGEIERALRAGYDGRGEPAGLVYTADVIDEATLERVGRARRPGERGLRPTCSSSSDAAPPGHRVWLRVNPGFGHGHSRKTNTGGEWSKHGIWHAYLDEALRHVEKYRLDLIGLHMHIGSGADFEHLRARLRRDGRSGARARRRRARDLGRRRAADPVPPGDAPASTPRALHALWDARAGASKSWSATGEPRDRAGPLPRRRRRACWWRACARPSAWTANRFLLVDAGFNDLARPVDVRQPITRSRSIAQARRSCAQGATEPTVVAGPLCESGDVFTQQDGGVVVPRELPGAAVRRPGGDPRRRRLRLVDGEQLQHAAARARAPARAAARCAPDPAAADASRSCSRSRIRPGGPIARPRPGAGRGRRAARAGRRTRRGELGATRRSAEAAWSRRRTRGDPQQSRGAVRGGLSANTLGSRFAAPISSTTRARRDRDATEARKRVARRFHAHCAGDARRSTSSTKPGRRNGSRRSVSSRSASREPGPHALGESRRPPLSTPGDEQPRGRSRGTRRGRARAASTYARPRSESEIAGAAGVARLVDPHREVSAGTRGIRRIASERRSSRARRLRSSGAGAGGGRRAGTPSSAATARAEAPRRTRRAARSARARRSRRRARGRLRQLRDQRVQAAWRERLAREPAQALVLGRVAREQRVDEWDRLLRELGELRIGAGVTRRVDEAGSSRSRRRRATAKRVRGSRSSSRGLAQAAPSGTATCASTRSGPSRRSTSSSPTARYDQRAREAEPVHRRRRAIARARAARSSSSRDTRAGCRAGRGDGSRTRARAGGRAPSSTAGRLRGRLARDRAQPADAVQERQRRDPPDPRRRSAHRPAPASSGVASGGGPIGVGTSWRWRCRSLAPATAPAL